MKLDILDRNLARAALLVRPIYARALQAIVRSPDISSEALAEKLSLPTQLVALTCGGLSEKKLIVGREQYWCATKLGEDLIHDIFQRQAAAQAAANARRVLAESKKKTAWLSSSRRAQFKAFDVYNQMTTVFSAHCERNAEATDRNFITYFSSATAMLEPSTESMANSLHGIHIYFRTSVDPSGSRAHGLPLAQFTSVQALHKHNLLIKSESVRRLLGYPAALKANAI